MNNKRTLVNLYKDIILVTRVVYQQQHKSCDSNRCLSDASERLRDFLWVFQICFVNRGMIFYD